jgi:hypothetical protein
MNPIQNASLLAHRQLTLKQNAAHEAAAEVPDDVAKALMTGAEAFCEETEGMVVSIPVIVPVVPLGRKCSAPV